MQEVRSRRGGEEGEEEEKKRIGEEGEGEKRRRMRRIKKACWYCIRSFLSSADLESDLSLCSKDIMKILVSRR